MTIFDALRKSHELQRKLYAKLLESSGDSKERRDIYQQLKDELQLHAKVEERTLYIPMMEVDLTQEKARHSIAEHHEMDEYLEQLDDTDMSSPQWLQVAKKLGDRMLHHLDEEEHEVFQLAGKASSKVQKEQLGAEYQLLTGAEQATA